VRATWCCTTRRTMPTGCYHRQPVQGTYRRPNETRGAGRALWGPRSPSTIGGMKTCFPPSRLIRTPWRECHSSCITGSCKSRNGINETLLSQCPADYSPRCDNRSPPTSHSVRQTSSDRCCRWVRPRVLLEESSSLLAWVLTRGNKPNPRGDDLRQLHRRHLGEPNDGLCLTAP
jgi:hypothetical protein